MGDSSGKSSTYESMHMGYMFKLIKEHGMRRAEEMIRARLEAWKDVEVKFAVTGVVNAGKSSFINAMRG